MEALELGSELEKSGKGLVFTALSQLVNRPWVPCSLRNLLPPHGFDHIWKG